MANWNKLTMQKFDAIKLLLKGGATQSKAAEIMDVSANTVYYVNRAKDYADYVDMATVRSDNRESTKKPQETQRVAPQTMTVQVPFYVTQEMKRTNELLTQISAKLAFIVEELCGSKKEG